MTKEQRSVLALLCLILCGGCQSGLNGGKSVEVIYEVASPVKLTLGALVNGEAIPGGSETFVDIIIKAPEAHAGKRMRLVLQRGLAKSRDDWLSGGEEWRPVGETGVTRADESSLSKGVILLRTGVR